MRVVSGNCQKAKVFVSHKAGDLGDLRAAAANIMSFSTLGPCPCCLCTTAARTSVLLELPFFPHLRCALSPPIGTLITRNGLRLQTRFYMLTLDAFVKNISTCL